MRKTVALSIILLIAVAGQALAVSQARVSGKIVDVVTKKPVADAKILIEAIEGKTVRDEVKARKDGSYAAMVLDGTIRYKFTVTAPGYQPLEQVLKLELSMTNSRDFELLPQGVATEQPGVALQADTTIVAYNEGAELANSGNWAAAAAKFEEAVAAKPDLIAGWSALAKTSLKLNNYPRAIEAAKKVLEVDEEDTAMWGVLHQAYKATGDKANAAAAEAKLPANANALFNQAARLINDGKDDEAETHLKRAIEVDPKMAIAYYQLGMVYVRTGKNADARQMLTKYIELDPNGRDVATAKEMLGYLK